MKTITNLTGQAIVLPFPKVQEEVVRTIKIRNDEGELEEAEQTVLVDKAEVILGAHEVMELDEVPEEFFDLPNILIQDKKAKKKTSDE